jgi:transcriptional regulator with XRE-family HTH domain
MANATPTTAWRAWRETFPGLTMNEVARRAGLTSGRLSIIERGVPPSPQEAARLRAALSAVELPEDLKAEDDEA